MKTLEFGFTAKEIIEEGRITVEEIEDVQAWVATQNLPQLNAEQVTIFLISCCNNLEDTKRKIRKCYNLSIAAPEISYNMNVDRTDLQKYLNVWQFFAIPERVDDGSVVLFSRLQDTNYKNFEMQPAMTLMTMTMATAYYDYPPTQAIAVIDMKGFGLMHLTKAKIRLVKLFFQFVQEGLPLKVKGIHVINTIYFIDKYLALLKPFIGSSFFDLIHFHPGDTDMEMFTKEWVPKRCLPKDYGGDLPHSSILHERHVEKLKQMRPHFEAEELQRRCVKF